MSPKIRVLVVDDEKNARDALVTLLSEEGYELQEAADGEEALAKLHSFGPDLVLADVRMPNVDGLELLRRAKEDGETAVFVMMTAHASIEAAVSAMKSGAENFLLKPLDVNAVTIVLEKALEKRKLAAEAAALRTQLASRKRHDGIIGESGSLQAVLDVVHRAAPTRATVLVLGESGTGKELIAQALHEWSPRAERPFIKVSCAALSESLLESELFGHERGAFTGAIARREGRFELADGGTLFLDEIGELTPSIQVKLLRVLQSREFERVGGTQTLRVDVRVVAATHRDLAADVKSGRFREDLFYRLNVVSVTLPPLRERKGDISALADHFIEKYAQAYGKQIRGLSPGTLNALLAHDWPGNVRELENSIERAVVLADGRELGQDDLPQTLRGPRPLRLHPPSSATDAPLLLSGTLYDIEREAILRTLERFGGSTSKAAEALGVSVRKIQYRLKEYASDGTAVAQSDEPEAG